MNNTSSNIFYINNISKKYGKKQIINNVSFSVEEGKCVGILGANGSGKTTLLSIIYGETKGDSGELTYDGHNLMTEKKLAGKLVGYVPQDNPLIDDLSVKDNLRLWYSDSPYDLDRELSEGFMKILGIDEYVKKQVKKISGGMKKKVSIAIGMHSGPRLLLLDEPGAALDVESKKHVREYLKTYMQQGGAVIMVTHDAEDLEICDKIYRIKDNYLVEEK